jgi:hypothetical protein
MIVKGCLEDHGVDRITGVNCQSEKLNGRNETHHILGIAKYLWPFESRVRFEVYMAGTTKGTGF